MSDIEKNKIDNQKSIDKEQPEQKPMALDDKKRIKVLSPGMLVFKRFIRNKLAIIGSFILLFMFAFSFLGGIFSPYGEKEIFHKYDYLLSDYAIAEHRTEFQNITLNDAVVNSSILSMLNSKISQFAEEQTQMDIIDSTGKAEYTLNKFGESCYLLIQTVIKDIASYNRFNGFTFENSEFNNDEFKNFAQTQIDNNETNFVYSGINFKLETASRTTKIKMIENPIEAILTTTLVFDSVGDNIASQEFKIAALKSLYNTKAFTYEEVDYVIEGDEDLYSIYVDESHTLYMNMSHFVVRRHNGEDTLSIDYKQALQTAIALIEEQNLSEYDFTYEIPQNQTEETFTDFIIYRKDNNYSVKTEQLKYLIDIYAPPSSTHWVGTDSNGMDVLTRMMYGGRISLLIGFIVVILETIIGTLLGGISGYFGKWIDNLIMRLVDIFNCIPFLPIMLIIGSIFDQMQMNSYLRIVWLMVIMGILGWSGIARLVRGQILSLREQEFMIAAEATGLSSRRRIARHLIPNVMPQLIVNATMGLGNVILLESTLSFLGLGAKYPIATWGAMINSVSNASDLVNYTHIWIPVGLLICLTVIAFNFVGDGLRDAFDPKMKR